MQTGGNTWSASLDKTGNAITGEYSLTNSQSTSTSYSLHGSMGVASYSISSSGDDTLTQTQTGNDITGDFSLTQSQTTTASLVETAVNGTYGYSVTQTSGSSADGD